MVSFESVVCWLTVVFVACKIIVNITHFLYSSWLADKCGRNIQLKKYGPWAVVTGATDGCGKVYAAKFASLGLNVVLISRSSDKLEAVAEEIRASCGSIEVKTIAVDFTELSIYSVLERELNRLEIGILVNNVGMTVEFAIPFHSIENEKLIQDVINCNCMSVARLSYIVIPGMIQRKKGIIINVGSMASTPFASMTHIYGASKAFVDKLSQDMATQCREHGIIVQSLLPGVLATKMSSLPPSILIPDAETYVTTSLRTLGIEARTAGYWMHKIMLYWGEFFYFFLPNSTKRVVSGHMDENQRKRALIINSSNH